MAQPFESADLSVSTGLPDGQDSHHHMSHSVAQPRPSKFVLRTVALEGGATDHVGGLRARTRKDREEHLVVRVARYGSIPSSSERKRFKPRFRYAQCVIMNQNVEQRFYIKIDIYPTRWNPRRAKSKGVKTYIIIFPKAFWERSKISF